MPSKSLPKYRKHSTKDQGLCDVYRHDGKRTKVYFPGPFNSPESTEAYSKLIKLIAAHGGKLPPGPGRIGPSDQTIDELVLEFLEKRVDCYYRHPDGTQKLEAKNFHNSLRPLTRLFGPTLARDFDSQRLDVLRQAMIDGSWLTDEERAEYAKRGRPVRSCRTFVNRNIGRILACFRWAVVKKIVPATVIVDLKCLPPLRRGDNGVRESEPVTPVDPAIVEKTLPFLPPVVADLVRVVMYTGARVGEICAMRSGDVDRSNAIWIYRPRTHKNLHRGHSREICCGPRAQLALRRHLKDDPESIVFSPREQAEMIRQAKRDSRKTPVPPSQLDRSKPDALRKPGERFNHTSVGVAIRRACRRAGVEAWHVHQLRHLKAQEITRELGAEAARAALGHRSVQTTSHYAGVDLKHASAVAAQVG